jgi:excinuclease UvrABC ATPase subunit
MINETYSAFVQGFMPTLARPDVDVLDGLTTAITIDQDRLVATARSTEGTTTDANAMLRVLFSRLASPHIGSPQAYSFNVASISGAGAVSMGRGGQTIKQRRSFSITGGMCPRCEGRGTVTDIDLTALYDATKSLNDSAISIPGYSMEGWYGRIFRGCGYFDPNKPIAAFTKRELQDLLHREPTKIKVDGINLTYTGLIPQIQKSLLSKDVDSLQPHLRAFVERAVTFAACPDCAGTRLSQAARSSTIEGASIADVCAMQITDLAEWLRALDEPSVTPLLMALRRALDSFVEIGLGYLCLDRPSATLSGGESQRIKMIRHLGSPLTDVTYIFDEPTIGLHPHDIQRMNGLLLQLRDKGNTVLVVEHKARGDRDRRPHRGPRARRRGRRRRGRIRGHPRAAASQRHPHRAAPRRSGRPETRGPHCLGGVRGARRRQPQPAGHRCGHPPRCSGGADRCGRVGQELADPRFGCRARGCGDGRPKRHQGVTS